MKHKNKQTKQTMFRWMIQEFIRKDTVIMKDKPVKIFLKQQQQQQPKERKGKK